MNDDADYDRKQLSPLITGCTATTSIDLQQRRGNRSKHKRIPNAKCGIALSPHSCHSQMTDLDDSQEDNSFMRVALCGKADELGK